MSTLRLLLSSVCLIACLQPTGAQTLIDLSQVRVPVDSFVRATRASTDTVFVVDGLRFRSVYDTSFGGFWTSGWAFSRSTDTTGSFTNLYGAADGKTPCCEPGSDTYLVGQQRSYILLPPNSSLVGLSFDNLAYTAATLERGSGFSKVFGRGPDGGDTAPDSLVLSVSGYLDGAQTFVRDLALADFRFDDSDDDFIIRDWTAAELTPGGAYVETDSVSFELKSSDSGQFGNNTPDFFAIGKLQARLNVTAVRNLAEVRPLRLYPNPARDYVNVEATNVAGWVTVVDATGRVVIDHSQNAGTSRLELSGLPAGQYFIILSQDGFTSAGQLTVR